MLTRLLATGVGIAGASYATYAARTWLRYGRVKRSGDAVLDRFMPEFEVQDLHEVDVSAPAQVTMATARQMRMDQSRIVRAIFRGRELIMRGTAAPEADVQRGLVDAMVAFGWGILADEPNEIVLGAVTKPWEANPQFVAIPADQFAAFKAHAERRGRKG